MKTSDERSIEQDLGISRRAILKTASAVAVGLAMGVPAGATCQAPASSIEYGGDTGQVKLKETNIYPLLAAWLILTTNGNPSALPADKATLMKVAGVGSKTADALIKSYIANSGSFSGVRTAFHDLASKFAAGAAPYNNGQCPDKAETLECIVALPCTLGNAKQDRQKGR